MSGPKQVFTTVVASNTTSATVLDLGDKAHDMISVNTGIPGAIVNVYGAATSTGTPAAIFVQVATNAVAFAALQLPTSTSGVWTTIKAPPHRYLTLACTTTCANGNTFTIIAG
jgi:hypothetical protein